MIDIRIIEIDLPPKVNGATVPNLDGTYDVYINSTLSSHKKQKVIEHEINHLQKNHFYNGLPVIINEKEADNIRPDKEVIIL